MKGVDGFACFETKKSKERLKFEKRGAARKLKQSIIEKANSFHFFNLPPEIRNDIYRHLGVRAVGIIINQSSYGECKLWYSWEGWSKLSPADNKILVSHTTDATPAQLEQIKAGKWKQPDYNTYMDDLASGKTVHVANRRDGGTEGEETRYDILSERYYVPDRLGGLVFLRQNKQFYAEAVHIFYTENKFIFDDLGQVDPPVLHSNGISYSFFSRHQPSLLAAEMLLNFAHMIGKDNFSFLREVQIEGTCILGATILTDSIYLPEALPIMAQLLNESCPNIKKLIICMQDGSPPILHREDIRVDYDHNEKVHKMIGMVVANLPYLRELRLGHYDFRYSREIQTTGKHNFLAPYYENRNPDEEKGPCEGDAGVVQHQYDWMGASEAVDSKENKGDIKAKPDEWKPLSTG